MKNQIFYGKSIVWPTFWPLILFRMKFRNIDWLAVKWVGSSLTRPISCRWQPGLQKLSVRESAKRGDSTMSKNSNQPSPLSHFLVSPNPSLSVLSFLSLSHSLIHLAVSCLSPQPLLLILLPPTNPRPHSLTHLTQTLTHSHTRLSRLSLSLPLPLAFAHLCPSVQCSARRSTSHSLHCSLSTDKGRRIGSLSLQAGWENVQIAAYLCLVRKTLE